MLPLFKSVLLLLLIVQPSLSLAQTDFRMEQVSGIKEVGNGGQSQGCYDKNNPGSLIYNFFDIWEVQYLDKSWKPRSYKEGSSYIDILTDILKDLEEVDPHRAAKYLKWLISFESEVNWLEDLQRTSDTVTSVKDKDCPPLLRKQVIVQQPHPYYKRYDIKVSQWNLIGLHDNTIEFQRAAAMIHEFLYRDMYPQGHRDSRHVRAFTTYLTSQKFQKMIKAEDLSKNKKVSLYLGKATKHHLGSYNYKGLQLLLPAANSPELYEEKQCPEDGSLRYAKVSGGALKTTRLMGLIGLELIPAKNSNIYFKCETGALSHFSISDAKAISTPPYDIYTKNDPLMVEFFKKDCFALENTPTVFFNENGSIKFCF